MAIWPTVTKPPANKCRPLCKLVSNSMHANLGQANDGITMKLWYHRLEWVSQSYTMPWKVWLGPVVPSLPDIKRVAQERVTSLKHCPLRPCLSCLRPDKASNILLMECSNATHSTICCILTKFRCVIKFACGFVKHWHVFFYPKLHYAMN